MSPLINIQKINTTFANRVGIFCYMLWKPAALSAHDMFSYYLVFCLQREKKNLQDLNGVFVFNVAEREHLDRPTARLIKEFDCIEGNLYSS